MHVGHAARVRRVSGGGVGGGVVGGGVVGGGRVGRRVGGPQVWWRLRVRWDGHFVNATAETTQSEVGQDPLQEDEKRADECYIDSTVSTDVKVSTSSLRNEAVFQEIAHSFDLIHFILSHAFSFLYFFVSS